MQALRPDRLLLVLLIISGVLLSACVDRDVQDVEANDAFEIARSIGRAIPREQLPAFEDGLITFDELEAALRRFRSCVAAFGIDPALQQLSDDAGLTLRLPEERADRIGDFSSCETRHLSATHAVYIDQQRDR
jgi:hypothetical protein